MASAFAGPELPYRDHSHGRVFLDPPDGTGCANRQSISHSSADHEQVQTARVDYNLSPKDMLRFRFQADTGLQRPRQEPASRKQRLQAPSQA